MATVQQLADLFLNLSNGKNIQDSQQRLSTYFQPSPLRPVTLNQADMLLKLMDAPQKYIVDSAVVQLKAVVAKQQCLTPDDLVELYGIISRRNQDSLNAVLAVLATLGWLEKDSFATEFTQHIANADTSKLPLLLRFPPG
jgi:hypothetical protein